MEKNYCQRAQQVIATTSLEAVVSVHSDHQLFVESKANTMPLTVQQYLSNPSEGAGGIPKVLSCKMKTAERINAANETGAGKPAPALGDTSCQAVNQEWLEQLRHSIPREQQALPPGSVVVDEEKLTFMGPMWLKPWPFEPVYLDQDNRIHLRSRALYVPHAWWIPMPDRFKGTYYCHLVSPLYLEALLRGELSLKP